jgi:hypothetical protein
MGWVGKLVAFTRRGKGVSDATADTGGGAQTAAQHFSSPGDDGAPLPGDYEAIVPQQGTGRGSAVGYVDPLNAQTAAGGEKRIYARDPKGIQVAEFWLKGDGTIAASNENFSLVAAPTGTTTINAGDAVIVADAGGQVTINGLQITKDGNMITAAGMDADKHKHAGNLGSPTGPPIL